MIFCRHLYCIVNYALLMFDICGRIIEKELLIMKMSPLTSFCCSGCGDGEAEIRQPRHAHIPDMGLDRNMLFELFVFCFSVMCLGLQYINLYKTVWWLPHSHARYALVRTNSHLKF